LRLEAMEKLEAATRYHMPLIIVGHGNCFAIDRKLKKSRRPARRGIYMGAGE